MRKLSARWWDRVLDMPADIKLMLLAPVVQARKGEHLRPSKILRHKALFEPE